MHSQFDTRSAILALALITMGSDVLLARPEMDTCGRPYPQLTTRCNVGSLALAVKSTETTKAIQAIVSPEPIQPTSDAVRIRSNRGRE